MPEKQAALALWANHRVRPVHAAAPSSQASSDEASTLVDDARAKALARRQKGQLHEAVLSICMDLSRHQGRANSHLAILGKARLERAAAGSRDQVADWIDGFR
ncbi:MAG: hypothetical protein PSV23_15320 [Brevundimonas sp.]|uniref:hypothetical protein n=1 Tax=Brevundimonas sp. TaxID=1871086 RepID=UPI002486E0E6|nr:hypothetical protein [Brevundimonas sp.]MDI1328162.1 hypothetical protein [Brevundimonas sp.]